MLTADLNTEGYAMDHNIEWNDVRYRGDSADVDELLGTYRVGDYLAAYEENQRHRQAEQRSELLRHGIRLSEHLSPRIYSVFGAACERLRLDADAEVFCLPDHEINAMAILDVSDQGSHSIVGITSAALERLDDDELASILGHELGHFLFQNHRLNALINHDKASPEATVLPPLGESLFLRWRKKSEISADRVGLLACGNVHAAGRALLKATFGLTERNINLDVDTLLAQIDEIKGKPELMDAAFASHPLLPIRLKALDLFSRSKKARRSGFDTVDANGLEDDALEDGIDELMRLTSRSPHKPIAKAVMSTVALGGIVVLMADGEISDYETKILVEVLHKYFTDEPEREIPGADSDIQGALVKAIAQVNDLGDHDDKTFIISRLADVALADGALMDREGAVVLQIAEQLHLPAKTAYGILVGAAEAVGFKVDAKLNRAADDLRRLLQIGFAARR